MAGEIYRGRFAPSPTGPLHLGSMFAALASFLQAKSWRGQWLLRIDDIDAPRVAVGAADSIRRTLERYSLYWDETVVMQSSGTTAYKEAWERLEGLGYLYPCYCSRKSLAALPRTNQQRIVYPGLCRTVNRSRKQAHALRVITQNAIITTDDNLQGRQTWDIEKEFGDFVIVRRDRIISYHLATVVDDWRSGITEVLRGFDLLESTPLQIHLQNLLGLTRPEYLHVPVIVDRHGIKLSKQNLAKAVDPLNPSTTLFKLLTLLKQSPPGELLEAPPEEILTWAVPNWDVAKLSGLTEIPANDQESS